MSRFIVLTILILIKSRLLLADYELLAMKCDDSITVKEFNLCTSDHTISILCEISSDTYGSNHDFKMFNNGTELYTHDSSISYDGNSVIENVLAYIYPREPQSIRYHCIRYNNTDDGSGTVDKVCGTAGIHVHMCTGTQNPIELFTQESEDATLHCLDAPEDSKIQWYFKTEYNIKFLGTGYTITIRNLTGHDAGNYTCIAVNHEINSTVAYAHRINLNVKEHFRTAHVYVSKRGAESVTVKCYPVGITAFLSNVNISKWSAQYTSLSPEQYDKWSAVESTNDTITLAGLTPSTWYLMKGQATDSTGKTVPIIGLIFSTDARTDHSTSMDNLSGSGDTSVGNYTYLGGIQYHEKRSVLVMAGDNVILECGFNMDHLAAHFDFEASWTRNLQEPVPKENSKYARQNQSLVINNVSSIDVDTYACRLKATPKDVNAGFTAAHMLYGVKVRISASTNRVQPSASVRVILPPLELRCVNSTSTTITMAWSDNLRNTDTQSFKVQYWKRMDGDATAEKKEVVIQKNSQVTRNEFTGLQPRTGYGFKIIAVDSGGYEGGAAMKTCVTL